MAIGPQVAKLQPATIGTIALRTKVHRRVDLTRTSVRRGHGVRLRRRKRFGLHGVSLTQSAMGLVRQALERFGLVDAFAPGFERLSWRGRGGHASRGPSDVQHNEEPHECQQRQLVVKQMRDHGLAPSKTGEDGGILPGFEAHGISRRVRVHDLAGWANYYSAVVSTKTFHLLDHRLYEKLRRWAFFRHPRKSRRWAIQRYWDTTPGKSWAFRDSNGPTLNQHTRVPIVRHVKVQGQASPYDGNWSYWAARRGKYPGVSRRLAALLKKQAGHCEACGLFFTPEDLIELHHPDGNRSDNRDINLAAGQRHR